MNPDRALLTNELLDAMTTPIFCGRAPLPPCAIITESSEVDKRIFGWEECEDHFCNLWFLENLGFKGGFPDVGVSWSIVDEFLDAITEAWWSEAQKEDEFRSDWEIFTRKLIHQFDAGVGPFLQSDAVSRELRRSLQWIDYSSRIFFCWRYLIPMTPKYKDRQITKPSDIDPEDDIVASQILAAFRAGYMPCGWDGPFPLGRIVAFRPDNADELPWVKAWRATHPDS